MVPRPSLAIAILILVASIAAAIGMSWIAEGSDTPSAMCRKAGYEAWIASTTFCVHPETGALYAPKFVRKP